MELIQLLNLFKYSFIESRKMPNLTLIQSINKFSFPNQLFSFVNQFENLTNNEIFFLSNINAIKRKGYKVKNFCLTKLQSKIIVIQELYDKKKGFQYKDHIKRHICMLMVFDKYFKCEFKIKKKDMRECIHAGGNKFILLTFSHILTLCEYKRRSIKIIKKWSSYINSIKKINDSEVLMYEFRYKFKVFNIKTLKEYSFQPKFPNEIKSSEIEIEPIDNRLCLLISEICSNKHFLYLLNYRNKTIITTIELPYPVVWHKKINVIKNYLIIPIQFEKDCVVQCWSLTEMKILYNFTFENFELFSMIMYEKRKVIIYTYWYQYIIEVTENDKIICSSKMKSKDLSHNTKLIEDNILLNFYHKKVITAIVQY